MKKHIYHICKCFLLKYFEAKKINKQITRLFRCTIKDFKGGETINSANASHSCKKKFVFSRKAKSSNAVLGASLLLLRCNLKSTSRDSPVHFYVLELRDVAYLESLNLPGEGNRHHNNRIDRQCTLLATTNYCDSFCSLMTFLLLYRDA